MPWRSAATARWWRRPRISLPPLPRRKPPASRRSFISESTPTRSRRQQRSPASAKKRWQVAAAKAGRIASEPSFSAYCLFVVNHHSVVGDGLSAHRERRPPPCRARGRDPCRRDRGGG